MDAAALHPVLKRPWPMAVVLGSAFVVLLTLSALAAAYLVRRWDAEEGSAAAHAAVVARAAYDAQQVAAFLDDQRRALMLIASQPEWRSALFDPSAAERTAAALRQAWPNMPPVAAVDAGGRVVLAAGAVRAGDDVASRRWFDAAARGALLSDEDPAVLVVQPLRDAAQRTMGALVWTIDCAAIERRLPGARRDAWAIVGRDGHVHCGSHGVGASLPAAALLPGPDWMDWPGHGRVLAASRRVEGDASIKALAWQAVTLRSVEGVPLTRGHAARALFAGTIALLLTLPLVLLLARRLARPLHDLSDAVNVARERFDYEPKRIPVRGTREAVAVGSSLRAMLEQIAQQQQAVDDSATGYRELFELHPLPMWVIDEETLRFIEVNAAARRKYGWRREEFLSMTVLDIQPPDAHAIVPAALREARDSEHFAVAWQHRLRSGEIVDVEVASRQLRWGGRLARIAAVMDVTSQRRASVQLQRQRRDLSELAQQLMTTEEAERRELAQVLHDRFAPTLYGAKLSLEALRSRAQTIADAPGLRHEVARVVDPLVQALDASIADTRGLMSELRPPLLVEHGLAAALQNEAERQQVAQRDVAIAFVHAAGADAAPVRHDVGLEYALFMIAHQALNNAILHAHARHITIDLDDAADRIRLLVRDDGCGFDAGAEPPIGHLGLVGMRERARWIGAALTVSSAAGEGTTVGVEWRRHAAVAA